MGRIYIGKDTSIFSEEGKKIIIDRNDAYKNIFVVGIYSILDVLRSCQKK